VTDTYLISVILAVLDKTLFINICIITTVHQPSLSCCACKSPYSCVLLLAVKMFGIKLLCTEL